MLNYKPSQEEIARGREAIKKTWDARTFELRRQYQFKGRVWKCPDCGWKMRVTRRQHRKQTGCIC